MSPKPVCCTCQMAYRNKIFGVGLLEVSASIGPYKLWQADLFYCPLCNHEIVGAFATNPTHHHEEDFEFLVESHRKTGSLIYSFERVSQALSHRENTHGKESQSNEKSQ